MFQVTGVFDSPHAAQQSIGEKPVDLVLSDLQFPEGTSLPWIKSLTSTTKTRVVVTSALDHEVFEPLCLQAGAAAFLGKDLPPQVYIARVKETLQSDVPEVALGDSDQLLSPREWEVLALFGQGLTTSAIAKHLFVSNKTVESHRCGIKRKLGIESKDRLISVAAQWIAVQGLDNVLSSAEKVA